MVDKYIDYDNKKLEFYIEEHYPLLLAPVVCDDKEIYLNTEWKVRGEYKQDGKIVKEKFLVIFIDTLAHKTDILHSLKSIIRRRPYLTQNTSDLKEESDY